jgi:hypothetical protein
MTLKVRYSENGVSKGLALLSDRVHSTLLRYAQTMAPVIQADMKAGRAGAVNMIHNRKTNTLEIGRPWVDRTRAAKERLTATVSAPSQTRVRITLAHGVNYGVWLELAHEERFAIIAPTVRKFSPIIVEDLRHIMDKMK